MNNAIPDLEDDGLVYPNGVDVTTGQSSRPILLSAIARTAAGESLPDARKALVASRKNAGEAQYGVMGGVNPNKIDEAGWCVVFAKGADPAVKEALKPLLDLRKAQAGGFYKECVDTAADERLRGLEPDEELTAFLERFGVAPGEPANAKKLPYYVLIVGDPRAVSLGFQADLDVTYAVGRICFDTPEEYGQYARQVAKSEEGADKRPKRAAFLATRNPGDRPTRRSCDLLVKPLAEQFQVAHKDWSVDQRLGSNANKASFRDCMGGAATPNLIFSATHGANVPFAEDPDRQYREQGALICQEWGGPLSLGALTSSQYFAAADVVAGACFPGTIAFHFACYGAGTPEFDEFAPEETPEPQRIAPRPFMARLPQAMLAKGALAVIGHVDRAWGYSFNWPLIGAQLDTFSGTIDNIVDGWRVGAALDAFNVRYAALAALLLEQIRERKKYKKANDVEVAGLWTATMDARNYALLGDPAARLAT